MSFFRPHRAAEAEDGSGADSPLHVALLSAAKEPGLSIETTSSACVFRSTRATRGDGTPWISSSLTDDFRFFPGAGGALSQSLLTRSAHVDEWRSVCRASGRATPMK